MKYENLLSLLFLLSPLSQFLLHIITHEVEIGMCHSFLCSQTILSIISDSIYI